VAGSQDCGTGTCGLVRKFDTSGSLIWQRTIGSRSHHVLFRSVSVAGGAVYVAGQTDGAFPGQEISGGVGAVLIRFGADGATRWLREFSAPGGASASDVAARRGSVYVTGEADSAGARGSTSVRRYDGDGTLRWARVLHVFPDEAGS